MVFTTAQLGDPELVDQCLAGKSSAWDTLVDRYGRLVYSIPRRYGMSDADSGDVVQNVFAIALQRLGQLRDRDRLSAWLISSTHRECWRLSRKQGSDLELDDRVIESGEPPAADASRWERQDAVRRALNELGDPCRSLLEALFQPPGPPDYEAISRKLGMPIGSIGPTRARCFRKLEPLLRKMGIEDARPVGATET